MTTPESWLGWPPTAWLAVDALAVYRLTRAAVKDKITERPRRWAATLPDRYEGPLAAPAPLLAYLASCPWCASVWVAAAVVALTVFAPLWWSYAATGLALAAVSGWLSDREL